MDKDRMGLVSSQKKGQVVVVNNGKKHLTRLVVDGWTTRRDKRNDAWDGNARSQYCFHPHSTRLSPRLNWPLRIVDIRLATDHAHSIGHHRLDHESHFQFKVRAFVMRSLSYTTTTSRFLPWLVCRKCKL
jgi:hypothetical protein